MTNAPRAKRPRNSNPRIATAPGGRLDARSLAARVLDRVDRDRAFAAAALDAELAAHSDLDARDRALATELVYGVLRTRPALLARVARHAPRGLPKDALVLSHLAIAAYQLLLLDRVPDFAAVDTAVSAIKAARGVRVAGFANALLRKTRDDGPLSLDDAVVESAPKWLLASLEEAVGAASARALFGAGERLSDTVSVRVVSGRDPEFLRDAEHGRASTRARILPRSGDLRAREEWARGDFVVQEEGAQLVALALGARPAERVLDACAGRGQKTSILREQVGPRGELWATDLHPAKLDALAAEFERLGLAPPKTAAVDWTVGGGGVPRDFDRVLVDAPCSGSGTLRRRPEIAARLSPEDPARLSRTAEAILRRATTHARPSGRVVFAVCSVLRDECERLVERVGDVLEPVPFDAEEVAPFVARGGTSFRLTPLENGTDGFFVASFRKRA